MVRGVKPSKARFQAKKSTDRARRKFRPHPNTKGKARATLDDVYEYAPSKVRRANVALSLDRHELQGRRHGSDDDQADMDMDLGGLNPEAMQKLRARLMQGDEDEQGRQGQIDSEDDEDIESEDAFEESDKEDFAGSGFVRRGTALRNRALNRTKRVVEKEVDLNEDSNDAESRSASEDEEDEEGDEEADEDQTGEFFDVLDVFDGHADVEHDEDKPLKVDKRVQDIQAKPTTEDEDEEWGGAGDEEDEEGDDDDRDDEGEEDEGEESEDDELRISASDSEDPSPEALADLETFLSKLDPAAPQKRKPVENAKLAAKKRRRVLDRTEAGEESEFGVRGSSTLQLDDLLAPLASSSSLAALKKSAKLLTSSSSKTKTLSAPLPQRAQERLDREAAYEKTKEEVDKWSATMKRIKEAEHLSFPLQAEKPTRVSNLQLAARFMPSNELESAVDKLLKSAQLRDEDIANTEGLKMAHLSVEEVAARRAELRMMRELVFRADKKAKRIAKIKSKTYRRIRRKQRERLDGDGDGDGDDDPEDEEARLKAEVERARERATLRHKNTGKWAKEMQGREGLDQDQRQAITEMLERGEKLRRRIHGENSGDEGDEENDESDEEEEERDEEQIKRGAFDELAALRAEDDATNGQDLESKSVFNMKFMRDAAARQSQAADAQAEQLQKELGLWIDEEDKHEEDETNDLTPTPTQDTMTMVQRTGGRLSFQPGAMPGGVLRSLGSLASDTSSVTLQSADLLHDLTSGPDPTLTPTLSTPTPTPIPPSIPNPWLVPTTAPAGPSRKRNEVRVHKGADVLTKSTNKLKKQAGKHEDERERAKDDAVLEINANDVLTISEAPVPSVSSQNSGDRVMNKKSKNKKARPDVVEASAGPSGSTVPNDDDSDAASEVEAQERAVEQNGKSGGKGVQAFRQRDLVALAFAGDNVVQAFEEAKRQETEGDAPREVDTTLPGWGAWGGSGTKKLSPRPQQIKSIPGIAPTARADHGKPHLIVSEKRDKKAAKYLVRELPHPYTSHAQFERRMDMPLGNEWNTRVGFQRGTLPRVVKKMGTVIDPLERLF